MCMLKKAALIGIMAVLPLSAWGAEDKKPRNKPAAGQVTAAPVVSSPAKVVYKPPLRGTPAGRVGGGTRGATERESFSLLVLAPDHIGYTVREQPCLYWYISKPTTLPVEVTVIERNGVKPALEKVIKGPEQGGIQSVCLADHGVTLRRDIQYKWFVGLVTDADQRSKDILAGGIISLIAPSPALTEKLKEDASGTTATSAYAEDGLWYDALDSISRMINAAPDRKDLRTQRNALLEQVGLAETTKFEMR
ncbi:MAG: DUF928 domain-containing protein [Desulfuromonadaceae bacterium]